MSPQNPLKPVKGMAPFAKRFASAEAIANNHRRIKVSAIEARLGTSFSADTLRALRHRFRYTKFVWLMGGDNLAQLPRWERWQEIMESVPIAVFDRPRTALSALTGKAALRYAAARIPSTAARRLAEMPAPAWTFFHTRLDPTSATAIRKTRAPRRKKAAPVISPTAAEAAPVTALPLRRRRKTAPATPAPPELLSRILASLDDGKAENVVTIDLAGKTLIADFMVIASGRSARQVIALADHLVEMLPRKMRASVEGKAHGDWVLIDCGDVIVHLFRPETRAYYNLEKMWGSAELPAAEAIRQ